MNALPDKLTQEIAVRLWHDEDTCELVKLLGVTPLEIGRVRDALPDMEE